MSATSTRSTGATSPTERRAERRSYWIAGIVLFGAIALLTTITVFTTSYGPRKDTGGQLGEQGGAKPHIIPRPGEGQAPRHPGDRGGWEQFLVLGLMVGAIGTIGGLAWRASRRARASAATAAGAGPTPPAVGASRPADRTGPST